MLLTVRTYHLQCIFMFSIIYKPAIILLMEGPW